MKTALTTGVTGQLIGDPGKAHQKLGWRHETSARELAREMVMTDLQLMQDAPIERGA